MAAGKVVYTSTLTAGTAGVITDGRTSGQQCATTSNNEPFVVVDLGVKTTISSVVISTSDSGSTVWHGFRISIMNDWRSCNSYLTFGNTLCNTTSIIISSGNVTFGTTSTCKGRFVAIAMQETPQISITVCEIQVFGSKTNVADIEVYQQPYERQCGVNNNMFLNLDLAIGKTSYGSSLAGSEEDNSITYATDGQEEWNHRCYGSYGYNVYYVVDLGAIVNISFVRIQNTDWDINSLALFDAVVSDEFVQCTPSQIFNYPVCSGVVVSPVPNDVWELKTDGTCVGRYFILRSRDITSAKYLKICEIEVYGGITNTPIDNTVTFENNCELTSDGSNIALGTTALAVYHINLNKITDGIMDQYDIMNACFFTNWAESNFVVINLGAMYQLKGVKVWNSLSNYGGYDYTMDILVGQSLRSQFLIYDINNFQNVAPDLKISDSFVMAVFNSSEHVIGQYIMIQKKKSNLDPLIVCQVEVFGTLIESINPTNVRPVFFDRAIPVDIPCNHPIATILRQGASYAYFQQYSGFIYYVASTVEGILWSPNAMFPYAVAGTYGLGRFLSFAKTNYFLDALNVNFDPIYKRNIYNWLSPDRGLNSNIVYSPDISTANDGDIVYFDINTPLTDEQQQQLLNYLQTGKVSLVIEMTYWAEVYYGSHRSNYDFLLRALQIEFGNNWIYDEDQQIPFTSSDFANNDFGDIHTKLANMAQNLPYLQLNGLGIINIVESYPDYLITSDLSVALNAVLQNYLDLVTFLCPAYFPPVSVYGDTMLIEVFNHIINLPYVSKYGWKAPCVDLFPGDITPADSVTSITTVRNIVAEYPNEIHATALYLLPGQNLTYSTTSIQGQWMITIGCHTDELDFSDTPDIVWNRFPIIRGYLFSIDSVSGTVHSPFGGVVWIENVDSPSSLEIQISGAIPTPYFNIRDPSSMVRWSDSTSNPGLWTEVIGQYIIITVPSECLMNYTSEDIERVIEIWDKTVSLMHALAGTDPNAVRRERIVMDINIAYGVGHAGYPIMVTYPWFDSLFDYTTITSLGSWGVVHELGHQRQQMYYSFSGTMEVTVNIFADFIWRHMWNVDFFSGMHEKYSVYTQQDVVSYFENGAQFADWQQQYGVAYVIYGQFGHHFGFGLYQQVFTNYTLENPSPPDDEAIISLWVTLMSVYSGNNLIPMFDFWGIPVSDQVRSDLNGLPCFLPLDPISDLVPDRYSAISAQYNDECLSSPSQTFELVLPNILITDRENDVTFN